MADPITIGLLGISTAMTVAGGLSQASAQRQSGEAEAAAGQAEWRKSQYLSEVAKINQKIAKQNADYEIKVGESEAQKVGLAGAQTIALQKTNQAAGNLDTSVGSPLQVRQSQQAAVDHDMATVRANAAKRAYGHEIEAMSAEQSSQLYQMGGDNALAAGEMRRSASETMATSSLLSTAGSVASRWTSASQVGMFGGSSTATPASANAFYGRSANAIY